MRLFDEVSVGPRVLRVTLTIALVALFALPAAAGEDTSGTEATTTPEAPSGFSDEALELASRLPVQDQGRIKPFSTWADFLLLRISGKKTFTPEADGAERMSATQWALECLLFPEHASNYHVVLVTDRDALVDAGLEAAADRKRDRYSFNDLKTGWEGLSAKASKYSRVEAADRSRIETQVLNLARNLRDLSALLAGFDYTRHAVGSVPLIEGDEASAPVPFSRALTYWPEISRRFVVEMQAAQSREPTEEARRLGRYLGEMDALASGSRVLTFLPPADPEVEAWLSVGDLVDLRRRLGSAQPDFALAPEHVEAVRRVEALEAARGEPARFESAMEALLVHTKAIAERRGEYEKIPMEVHLYELDPFFKATWLFVLAFVLIAVTWIVDLRWLRWSAIALMVVAELLVIYGITLRCLIRDRPPVSTLYETVLFITACSVLVCFVMEAINRRRIALALTPVLGSMGLLLASKYEIIKGEDTMPQLQAVLDTNYWLTLHVLTVTFGYAAGLMASAVGHVYVLGRVFGVKNEGFFGAVAKMVYGLLCFTLLLSTVGTILGGVWANDSWGRFWGWDPKENGALMIVLWTVIILHSRLGGYLKPFGISMAAIFGGAVVAASWWGVNLLGIGLHSYGFTAGIAGGLLYFAIFESAILASGGVWYLLKKP